MKQIAKTGTNEVLANVPMAVLKNKENQQEAKQEEQPKSINELKAKIEKMHLLSEKHARLTGRLIMLEKFAIKSDNDTARMTIQDARGERFESSNPTSIGRLIEIWRESYKSAIDEVETDMFEALK